MTLRPPLVFMRTRKPWVRARRVLEGWYVRFMMNLQKCCSNKLREIKMPAWPQNVRTQANRELKAYLNKAYKPNKTRQATNGQ